MNQLRQLTGRIELRFLLSVHLKKANPTLRWISFRYEASITPSGDGIVMKTLEKNRDRRYETANGLVADIGRYLRGEAILARPPSVAYKLRKFAGRNKAVVVSGLLIMTTLLAGAAVSTWQAVLANRAQLEALAAAEVAMQAKEDSE